MVDGDDGFRALFDSLNRDGPRAVPSRSRAASLTGRSESSFKRHFHLVTGRTWRAFLTEWRLAFGVVYSQIVAGIGMT